jgi:hypothetical protein
MRLIMIFAWNDVDSCFKLYFHVWYASICSKLSSLSFWMLILKFLRVFHFKLESRACLFVHTRLMMDECSLWLGSVFFMFPRNMSARLARASRHVSLSLARSRCKPWDILTCLDRLLLGARLARLSGQDFIICLIKWNCMPISCLNCDLIN